MNHRAPLLIEKSPLRHRTIAVLVVLELAAATLPAEVACWAPDRRQPPDPAVARAIPLAQWNADIDAVAAVLKRNRALLEIPDTRLGITSYIGYPSAGFGNAVRVSAGLYPKNTWRDGCTLMEGPEFFNEGHVHVTFNEPREIWSDIAPRIKDEGLIAYAEPTAGEAAGAETFYESIRGVVLTPDGVPPWVPVTRAEMLERDERLARAEVARINDLLSELDTSVESYRADMRKQIEQERDPAIKAQLRAAMESNAAMLVSGNAEAREQYEGLLAGAEAKLEAVRGEGANLSDADRATQARLDGTPLVKTNPALAGGKRRVNLIVVNALANDRSRQAPLEGAVRAIDYPALRVLLR
jgi:hypothetical protein